MVMCLEALRRAQCGLLGISGGEFHVPHRRQALARSKTWRNAICAVGAYDCASASLRDHGVSLDLDQHLWVDE